MTDALALALRVGLSLAAVLGVLWIVARMLRGGASGRSAGAVEVLARQNVGRNASVAVVRVADRALVLGVTDQGVALLTDTDLRAVSPEPAADPVEGRAVGVPARAPSASSGPLVGSVLHPATWRTAVDVVRERTVRRG